MASTDDADAIGPIRMDHHDQALSRCHPNGNETRLFGRVRWVGDRPREGIAEDGGRVLEGNAMNLEIPGGFLRVPFELHRGSLQRLLDFSGPSRLAEHRVSAANGAPTIDWAPSVTFLRLFCGASTTNR